MHANSMSLAIVVLSSFHPRSVSIFDEIGRVRAAVLNLAYRDSLWIVPPLAR
jgi:hypothetical protein